MGAKLTSHQICTNCVMDTTDPTITFNSDGICNYCQAFEGNAAQIWFPNEAGQEKLNAIINHIKSQNAHKKYDCIIGLSGGVDSSYLAYWAKKHANLRLLAVHVDGGWNSEIAVSNIEKIVTKLNIDLITQVINWEEMADLQRAFLRAGVANQDTPQDHAFFAGLYHFANKNNIKYVLSGFNFSTESVLPKSWGHSAMDWDQIRDIHKKFGQRKLNSFPTIGFFKNYIYYPYMKRMKVISPLNYMHYNKNEAIKILNEDLNWEYYGGKHYESRFTQFFQSFFLPVRFGFDKRKAHLSSLILSRQLSRTQALQELSKPPYDEENIHYVIDFVCKKLSLQKDEFDALLKSPISIGQDYKTNLKKQQLFTFVRYCLSLPGTVIRKLLEK